MKAKRHLGVARSANDPFDGTFRTSSTLRNIHRQRMIGWAVFTLVLFRSAGCGIATHPQSFDPIWSFEHSYVSEDEFREWYLRKDKILIYESNGYKGELTRIDPATGAVLWKRSANKVTRPQNSLDPLWIVDEPANEDYKTLIRLDPDSGKELRRVSLKTPLSYMNARLIYVDGLILATSSYGELVAVDLDTGEIAWKTTITQNAYLQAPVVIDDIVLFVDNSYVAIDAKDGREVFRINGVCCGVEASPDGKALYIQVSATNVARIDRSGRTLQTVAGELRSVSNHYVVVQQPHRLAVFRHGQKSAVWVLPTTDEHYLSGVALWGHDLFYFSAKDGRIWRVNLKTARQQVVEQLHEKLVISTETSGRAPATLTKKPTWDPPYLFIIDWNLRTYRLK